MAKRTNRRRFLAGAAAGIPVVAAGGALGSPLSVAARESSSSHPETLALRKRNTMAALAERGQGTSFDVPSLFSGPGARPLPAPGTTLPARLEAGGESEVARMQRELATALEKPMAERKWAMVIDLNKCIGCSACTVACIAENHLPPGVVYRPVIEEELGEYPNVTRRFTPRPCMQCDDPPCVPVCPVSATYKRPDGIVEVNYDKCIGCRYCMVACPYGSRYFDFGEHYTDGTPERQHYEEAHSPEYGRDWSRESVEGVVRKCQFCVHRLEAGMLPACVTTCIGGATYFGDANDPDTLVHELQASGRLVRLKEELGTKPKVSYLL
jgi:Fe-S-cluster-containing dehydrogenase component